MEEMSGLEDEYRVGWNGYRSNMLVMLNHVLQTGTFADITLVCQGTRIKCHKMVLAACSTHFQKLIMENEGSSRSMVIIVLGDIKVSEMLALLQFMYRGEMTVPQSQLAGLFKAAEKLRVKGLVSDQDHSSDDDDDSQRYSSPLQSLNGISGSSQCSHAAALPCRHVSYGNKTQAARRVSRKDKRKLKPRTVLEHMSLQHNAGFSDFSARMHDEDRCAEIISKGTTPSQPQPKRYKQYTEKDVISAIDAVKQGTSSILAAARINNVPSRTLYDKVKKLGIPTNNQCRNGKISMSPHLESSSDSSEGQSSDHPGNDIDAKEREEKDTESPGDAPPMKQQRSSPHWIVIRKAPNARSTRSRAQVKKGETGERKIMTSFTIVPRFT